MWGQSGGCDHTLQWKVLKFREIKWLSKSTQWWMPAPSQILLPLVLCRWDLDALERKTQPKKKLKSSFHHLSLYFHLWSIIQVSSEAKLLRRTIGFHLSILHRFFTWTTMSQQPFQCHFAEWRVFCLASKLAQSSEFSTPNATWWLHQLASLPLTKSGWGVNVS